MNIILLTMIYCLYFYEKWRLKSKRMFVLNTAFYFYIVIVLFFTIMPFRIPLGNTNYFFTSTPIFIPFYDLMQGYAGALQDIVLNCMMLIPFGFLLPLIRRTNLRRTILMSFLFSLSIESYQLINSMFGTSSRIFDVTDLMTNTFGGWIGYIICYHVSIVAKKQLKFYKQLKTKSN